MENKENFTIVKKIAKHGNQAVIVIPRILEEKLSPGTIVELNLNILKKIEDSELKQNGGSEDE